MTSTLANVSAGDLVIALVQRNEEPYCTGVSMAGTAMTKVKMVQSGGGDLFNLGIWAVLAPSAVPSASIVASFASSAAWGSMVTARWSGVSSATPLASSCNTAGCSGVAALSTSRTAQQITTAQGALILGVGTDWDNYNTHTAANSFTKRFDNAIAGGGSSSVQFMFDRVAAAGDFGGALNFSTAASDRYLSALLAFA